MLCGKVLGDLGADVIVIEKPGGGRSRDIGPFYKDTPHPEKSLFWMAYNINKREITLDIETRDGQELFKRLVKTAQFVIESFPPGHLEGLGLGYSSLSQINPGLVMTSITPFGQTGPKASYATSDLTVWASAGTLFVNGDPDRPPVGLSFVPQPSLIAGIEGAVASLIAHYYRVSTGEGQHVDVSQQEACIGMLQALIELWDLAKYNYPRSGNVFRTVTGVGRRILHPCKDGYVAWVMFGGPGWSLSTIALLRWMDEEGMAPDFHKNFDWINDFDITRMTQEDLERLEEPFIKFLLTKTKGELFERAIRDGIMLAPINAPTDVVDDPQLAFRGFWNKVHHPELGEDLTYCGAFAKLSETPCVVRRRPPLIGEHNEEILVSELGLSKEQLLQLKQAGIV